MVDDQPGTASTLWMLRDKRLPSTAMIFPLFDNRSVGSQVTIDLDVFFTNYIRPIDQVPNDERVGLNINATRDRLKLLEKKLGTNIEAKYRRSSSGNVHVRLYFPGEVSVLDAFMIRAWMFDDQTRLALDMARYLKSNDLNEMNRCFDEKGKINGAKKAGAWIPIYMIPTLPEDPQKKIEILHENLF